MNKHHLNIALFLIPLFLLGALNLITPHKPAVSQLENRTLKTKPLFTTEKLFRGEYFQEYEDYFADNFIFRENFVKLSGKIKNLWSLPGKDEVSIVGNKGANVAATQNKENDISETKHDEKNQASLEGRVLVLNDCAMEIHTFNAEACQYYADFLNQFQENLPDNKIKVYSLIAPTQIEFITELKYKDLSSPQKETIAYVNKHLAPQIIPVDAYQSLAPNTKQYIYFRSDHHWTALGAYYAYTAFMKAQHEKPIPLEQYKTEKVAPYLGSLYSTTLSQKIRENPDTVFLYQPFIKHEYIVYYEHPIKIDLLDMRHAENKNKYGIFLGGDHPWGKITTSIKNGKKIMIIKDSYANAFVPFLLPHYEEIYIVDPRQFNLDLFAFIQEKEIQEVLFLNYVLVTDNNGFTDLLRQMANLP
ncbi:MAG: DHHW family protein [Clostridia bacterium]|nr:DHHW family protein [Clostridia bacterium]